MRSKTTWTTRSRICLSVVAAIASLGLATTLGANSSSASFSHSADPPSSRTSASPSRSRLFNPVSTPAAPSFPDPAVIRGKDGWWYAFATSDPSRPNGPFPQLPILRSPDLVHWDRVGQVFPGARPSWVTPTAGLWAPDIRFIDGRYVLYYVATDTVALPGDADSAIGVATASTPTGPWTDAGAPVVAPRSGNGSYLGTIDPAGFTDRQGRHWLYWSSFNGGGFVTRVSDNGLHTVGAPKRILIDNRYEGVYVVSHGDWYYAFASSTNCCAGPVTGYTVFAGRSHNPDGPFVDHDGVSLDTSRVGGTQVIAPYGNRWIGTGHNSVVTDAAGQDWFVYHAIPRDNPYLQPGISRRPMLVDRVDWINGWPIVRAGRGASDTPVPGPLTSGVVHDLFTTTPAAPRWLRRSGTWVRRVEVTSGGYVAHADGGSGILESGTKLPAHVRVMADVRLPAGAQGGSVGLAPRYVSPKNNLAVRVDRGRHALVVDVVNGGRHSRTSAALPGSFGYQTWHTLAAEVHGNVLTATISSDDLSDTVATVRVQLPRHGALATPGARRLALLADGPGDVDNASAARLYRPIKSRAPLPRTAGVPLSAYSTEFVGSAVPAGWSWVREDPAARVANGVLRWPVQAGDLNNTPANASVLVHDAPAGDWVAETKVTLPLGVDSVRNYQQAGIAAYASDVDIARLDTVAIWNTRQIEFNRKLDYNGTPLSSGTVLGHAATTVWLRLYAHHDPATGELKVRAASSTNGSIFEFGGTWDFAPGITPKIGLVSLGGAEPAVAASFDYIRVYRLASPRSAGFPR